MCAAPALAEPTLEARAILPADATAPAPFPGAPDTEPQPAPGARQPVGGFSALIDGARGATRYWAMPDNGFGSKANSRSFILRLYKVRAGLGDRAGGAGTVEIEDWITLSDPDDRVPWEIVNEGTSATAADGRRLRHRVGPQSTAARPLVRRRVRPVPAAHRPRAAGCWRRRSRCPTWRSPDNPACRRRTANLARCNGFEGWRSRRTGRTLHPVLEGPVAADRRPLRAPDVRVRPAPRGRYTPFSARVPGRPSRASWWPTSTALDGDRIVVARARQRQGRGRRPQAGVRDPTVGATGLAKREVADLLALPDPAGISLPGRARATSGSATRSRCHTRRSRASCRSGASRLAIVNDTNFGSRGRNPSCPTTATSSVDLRCHGPAAHVRTLADDRRHPVRRRAGSPRSRAPSPRSTPTRTCARHAPRRHQERLEPLRRRVLPPASGFRDVRRSARLHARRQRVDRLSPAANGGYVPHRAAGEAARALLPARRTSTSRAARAFPRTSCGRPACSTARARRRLQRRPGAVRRASMTAALRTRRDRAAPEYVAREAAALEWIDRIFDVAEDRAARRRARDAGRHVGRQHRGRAHRRPARASAPALRAPGPAAPGRHARLQDRPAAARARRTSSPGSSWRARPPTSGCADRRLA